MFYGKLTRTTIPKILSVSLYHICGIHLLNPYKTVVSHLKGELKAEISNFSNIFFAKSNISEVNFVKLFSLVYWVLRENYV